MEREVVSHGAGYAGASPDMGRVIISDLEGPVSKWTNTNSHSIVGTRPDGVDRPPTTEE